MARRQWSAKVLFRLLPLALALGTGGLQEIEAGNWPQWRGPTGDSVSQEQGLPVRWSETAGLAWKAKLPEWGTSTPAIWGDAVFLTSESDGQLLLMRLDKRTGDIVWTQQVGAGTARRKSADDGKRSSKFHDLHNLASPSPVTDGTRVIVHFGDGELASYTFDGKCEWRRNLAEEHGKYTIWWGHANSPVLYENLVIAVCMQDSLEGAADKLAESYLAAYDKQTGKLVWKTSRMTGADAEQGDSYTTPIFFDAGRRTEMIVMGSNQLDAYDPQTGKQLWYLPGLVGGRTITGPTAAGGMIYTTTGMRGALQAIKPGGTGKLADTERIVWKQTQSTPDSCCPVVWNGLLFLVTDNGIASCFDAQTGAQKWRERLGGRDYKASPLAAEGRVYFLSKDGVASVVRADGKFEVLAENKLDDEFLASPAVSDGRLYLRGRHSLYSIGK
jgi:outer membrane protein assembly factor BamB